MPIIFHWYLKLSWQKYFFLSEENLQYLLIKIIRTKSSFSQKSMLCICRCVLCRPQHHNPTIQQTRQIAQPEVEISLLTSVVTWNQKSLMYCILCESCKKLWEPSDNVTVGVGDKKTSWRWTSPYRAWLQLVCPITSGMLACRLLLFNSMFFWGKSHTNAQCTHTTSWLIGLLSEPKRQGQKSKVIT